MVTMILLAYHKINMVAFSRPSLHALYLVHLLDVAATQNHIYNHKQRRKRKREGTRLDKKAHERQRKTIDQIYRDLGPIYFKRAFRMTYSNFTTLLTIVKPYLTSVTRHPTEPCPHAPNGFISESIRLACAIRYFAGGDPYDLQQVFGISHTSVHLSVAYSIEAINMVPEFRIAYPEKHREQANIAEGFRKKSVAQLNNCAGCLDGFLLWSHQPTVADCAYLGVDPNKFFSGRKHKHGLNVQAICNA